jgi:hypothetical protein
MVVVGIVCSGRAIELLPIDNVCKARARGVSAVFSKMGFFFFFFFCRWCGRSRDWSLTAARELALFERQNPDFWRAVMLIAHADRLRWVSGGSRCHWHPKSSVPLFFFLPGRSLLPPLGASPKSGPPDSLPTMPRHRNTAAQSERLANSVPRIANRSSSMGGAAIASLGHRREPSAESTAAERCCRRPSSAQGPA